MVDAVGAVVALGGPAPPPAPGAPRDDWAEWAEELSRLREALHSAEAQADQAARDGLGLEGQQAQLREAIGAQERVCARSEAALLLEERAQICCLLTPRFGQRPLVRWRRSTPVTQRQGGSGVHVKVDTKPCVWSVYYRLVRISLVWSDTTSYPTL